MGKIVSNFFISLDGVVEAPDKWHFPYFDDEMGAVVGQGFATTDAMLMGRKLYDEWSEYWPEHSDDDWLAEIAIEEYAYTQALMIRTVFASPSPAARDAWCATHHG